MPQVHEIVAGTMAAHGVDTVFGLVGDGNIRFILSMVDKYGARYVPSSGEAGATSMADGYARATGKLGVASVTHGPGLTNTVTALTEAARNGTAMVLVAGDRPAFISPYERGVFKLQGIDQQQVILATGAGYETVRSPQSASSDTARAVERAIIESRPIVLGLPADLVLQEGPSEFRSRQAALSVPSVPAPAEADLDQAVGAIASAQRPLVLAGRGALTPDAMAAVVALADRLEAPIATTLLAKDAFNDSGRAVGIFGTFSLDSTLEWITKSDTVIAVGASLNAWTTMDGTLLGGKRVIHIDRDLRAFGKWVEPTSAVRGDVVAVIREALAWLDVADVAPSGFLAGTPIRPDPAAFPRDRATGSGADIEAVMPALNAVLPENRNLVFDLGRFWVSATKALTVSHPGGVHHAFNYGSIGLGTSTGIGVAVGDPDRTTIVITGDGGFMDGGLVELPTAARNRLDLIVVVLNDSSYGAEHLHLRTHGLAVDLSMMAWPDFAEVAGALGVQGVRVGNLADVEGLGPVLAERKGTLLINVELDPDLIAPDP